jgi:hypothetical protein
LWGRGMTESGAPQNNDFIHRITAAPGKTDRILLADAPVRPKPELPDPLREALYSRYYGRRTEQIYCHWGSALHRDDAARITHEAVTRPSAEGRSDLRKRLTPISYPRADRGM